MFAVREQQQLGRTSRLNDTESSDFDLVCCAKKNRTFVIGFGRFLYKWSFRIWILYTQNEREKIDNPCAKVCVRVRGIKRERHDFTATPNHIVTHSTIPNTIIHAVEIIRLYCLLCVAIYEIRIVYKLITANNMRAI